MHAASRHESPVAPIAAALGELLPGMLHLLSGAAGTGKSVLGCELLLAGLAGGRTAVLLTQRRAEEVLQLARGLALDLETPLREGRLQLLTYDNRIGGTITRAGLRPMLVQIDRLLDRDSAAMLVFDPIEPVIGALLDDAPLRAQMRALAEWADRRGHTVVLIAQPLEPGPTRTAVTAACATHLELGRPADTDGLELAVGFVRYQRVRQPLVHFRIRPGGTTLLAGSLRGAEPDAPRPDADRTRILIVDDEVFDLEGLCEALAGYETVTARDGLEALSAVWRERPSLLVLDMVLPRLSGYEVCRTLRRGGVRIPILLVSGRLVRSGDRVRGLLLGGTDYLVKPFQPAELALRVRNLLAAAPATLAEEIPDLDPEGLLADPRGAFFSPEEFARKLAEAKQLAGRVRLPLTLVGFEPRDAASAKRWDELVERFARRVRGEDLLCRLSDGRLLLLLVDAPAWGARRAVARMFSAPEERDRICCGFLELPASWSPDEAEALMERVFDAAGPLEEATAPGAAPPARRA